MEIKEAILSFSQSEKIKAGLIWVSQGLGLLQGLSGAEKPAGEKVVNAFLNMIAQEINLVKKVTGNESWNEIEACIDRVIIMVESGVGEEANVILTRALSKVTSIGHQSMTFLREGGYL